MGRNKKDIWRMKKTAQMTTEGIIRAIVISIVVLVVLFILVAPLRNLILPILGFNIPGQDQQQIEPLTDYDFYSTFVKEYKLCKLSPLTECRCKIASLENRLPAGYAIELAESGGDVEISLLKFTLAYENDKCRFNTKEKDTAAESAIIRNDALFTLDGAKKTKLTIVAIRKGNGCPLEGTLLNDYSTGSQENVLPTLGSFSNHIARFESRTQFFSKDDHSYIKSKWDKLFECKTPENIEEADNKFEAFVKEVDEFNSGTEATKTIKIELPKSYKMMQTGIEVSLYWGSNKLTSLQTSLCQTDKDLPNGNYALTKYLVDTRSSCAIIQLQNP